MIEHLIIYNIYGNSATIDINKTQSFIAFR